jgi:hypothetical protein
MEKTEKPETSERIGTKVRSMVEMIIRSQKTRMVGAGFKPAWNLFQQTTVWEQMQTHLTPEYQSLYQEIWDRVRLSDE